MPSPTDIERAREEGDDMRFPYHVVGEVHVNVVPRAYVKKYRPLLAYGYE